MRELPAILGDDVRCIQIGSPGLVPVSFDVFRLLLAELCRALLGVKMLPDLDQQRTALAGLCPEQSAEFWPAMEVLLGLSDAESAGLGASVEAQQRLLAEAVRDVLACAAARQPLVWICEDLHEADDASLAVLEQTACDRLECTGATVRYATRYHSDK